MIFFFPVENPKYGFKNFYWYFTRVGKRLSNWYECWQERNAEHDKASAYAHA